MRTPTLTLTLHQIPSRLKSSPSQDDEVDPAQGLECSSCKCGEKSKKEEEADVDLEEMAPLKTLDVKLLDEQHEACVSSLNALVKSRGRDELLAVQSCIQEHFRFEEAFLAKHQFGGLDSEDRFSALGSHARDHERIMKHIGEGVEDCSECGVVPSYLVATIMDNLKETKT